MPVLGLYIDIRPGTRKWRINTIIFRRWQHRSRVSYFLSFFSVHLKSALIAWRSITADDSGGWDEAATHHSTTSSGDGAVARGYRRNLCEGSWLFVLVQPTSDLALPHSLHTLPGTLPIFKCNDMIHFKVWEAGKTNKTESTSGWFQEWQSAVASVRVVFDVHFHAWILQCGKGFRVLG